MTNMVNAKMTKKINGRNYETIKTINGKYIIVNKKTKKQLLALNGNKIGGYDYIDWTMGFLQGESDYCIVKKNNKYAILDISNNEIITDWYNGLFSYGFVEGQTNYCIVEKNNQQAILDVVNNKIITDWYEWIYYQGRIGSQYKYSIVRQDDKEAIIDTINDKIITGWYQEVFFEGFLEGKSGYSIVEENNKYAILDISKNKIVTNWYYQIFIEEFFDKNTKYCKFKLLDNKFVSFDLLNKIYQNSLIDKVIMTVKFKENLWEYWYKCF